MILMIGGTIIGVVLGALALQFAPQKPPVLAWIVLGFGVIAFIAILPILQAIVLSTDVNISPVPSILAGAACMVSGLGAVVLKHYRRWQVWLGLALGGVPVAFWLVFMVGEILFPH